MTRQLTEEEFNSIRKEYMLRLRRCEGNIDSFNIILSAIRAVINEIDLKDLNDLATELEYKFVISKYKKEEPIEYIKRAEIVKKNLEKEEEKNEN